MARIRSIMHSIVVIAAAATTVTVLCSCDELLKPVSSAENSADKSAGSIADQDAVGTSTETDDSSEWPKKHTIKPDDTLFSLAKKYYDDGSEWERIAQANPGVDATGLMVGNPITIPAPR